MRTRKKRHLSSAGFLLCLALLIAAIFLCDAIYRAFFQHMEENIIGTGGFSLSSNSNSETDVTTPAGDGESGVSAETTTPNGTVLELSSTDLANGTLVNVDLSHPYVGSQNWTDFSAVSNENVRPRDTSLPIQAEITSALGDLFDAYAVDNGYVNLQINSTTDATLALYSNSLPDRSTGYGFDIGLITSTGEVVPYIQKHNEWMMQHAWEYGFIVRYPSDKTDITGIAYAPHHFRYVGKVHAAIMYQNNYCLEEYLQMLQSYPLTSSGFSYSDGTQSYSIYYIPADASGTTTVTLEENTIYEISGDNRSGFVLTITHNAASDTTTAITEETTIPPV